MMLTIRPILLTNTDDKKIVLNANLIISVIPHRKGTEVCITDVSYYVHEFIVQETPEEINHILKQ